MAVSKNVFTTLKGKKAAANPAKKPGLSGDKRQPRKALVPFKKKK